MSHRVELVLQMLAPATDRRVDEGARTIFACLVCRARSGNRSFEPEAMADIATLMDVGDVPCLNGHDRKMLPASEPWTLGTFDGAEGDREQVRADLIVDEAAWSWVADNVITSDGEHGLSLHCFGIVRESDGAQIVERVTEVVSCDWVKDPASKAHGLWEAKTADPLKAAVLGGDLEKSDPKMVREYQRAVRGEPEPETPDPKRADYERAMKDEAP